MTDITFENMLNLFSVMPGLTKDKPAPKKTPKLEEDEKMDEVIDDEAAMLKEFNENKEQEIADKVKEEPESDIKFFALQLGKSLLIWIFYWFCNFICFLF